MKISVNKLASLWQVFSDGTAADVWGTFVTQDLVNQKIAAKDYQKKPWSKVEGEEPNYDHAARIAYMCVFPDTKPIDIDVGVPAINYHNFCIEDGNHRFAAALVLGSEFMYANISGQLDHAESLLA